MFLRCNPTVCVIGSEYEILISTRNNGLCWIDVGGKKFYSENSGVLCTEKNFHKIRVPQKVLDEQSKYDVVFEEIIKRKAYFSELKSESRRTFLFKVLTKESDINIYHIADVHYKFDIATKTCSYFGCNTDVFVVNGDIGEVETQEDYFKVIKFIGDISEGRIPVIFVRGNHDTRGKLAEMFTDYFPANGKNTFYSFSVGAICGVVLDCGEDKLDSNQEYGGVNNFEQFRKKETNFLMEMTLPKDKIPFAISHICPVMTTLDKGGVFDIERETYFEWNKNLERIGIKFMLTGHLHKAFLIKPEDKISTLQHNYPIIVGSAINKECSEIVGTAIVLNHDKMEVKFTDNNQKVVEEFVIKF